MDYSPCLGKESHDWSIYNYQQQQFDLNDNSVTWIAETVSIQLRVPFIIKSRLEYEIKDLSSIENIKLLKQLAEIHFNEFRINKDSRLEIYFNNNVVLICYSNSEYIAWEISGNIKGQKCCYKATLDKSCPW